MYPVSGILHPRFIFSCPSCETSRFLLSYLSVPRKKKKGKKFLHFFLLAQVFFFPKKEKVFNKIIFGFLQIISHGSLKS